jgi:hypothetical protein
LRAVRSVVKRSRHRVVVGGFGCRSGSGLEATKHDFGLGSVAAGRSGRRSNGVTIGAADRPGSSLRESGARRGGPTGPSHRADDRLVGESSRHMGLHACNESRDCQVLGVSRRGRLRPTVVLRMTSDAEKATRAQARVQRAPGVGSMTEERRVRGPRNIPIPAGPDQERGLSTGPDDFGRGVVAGRGRQARVRAS